MKSENKSLVYQPGFSFSIIGRPPQIPPPEILEAKPVPGAENRKKLNRTDNPKSKLQSNY